MATKTRTANQSVGTKYHVYLDDQGFIIQDGSYQEKNVPFSVPRFATGDPSLADFSAFQYAGQTDWAEGLGEDGGQRYFVNPSQFKDSEFIDISDKGQIKLLKPLEELVDAGAGNITQIKSYGSISYFALQKSGGSSEIWQYDGSATPTVLANLSAVGGSGVSSVGDFQSYRNKLQFPTQLSQLWYTWDGANLVSSAIAATHASVFEGEQLKDYLYYPSIDSLDRYDGSGKVSAASSWTDEFDTFDYLMYRPKVFNNKIYLLAGKRGKTSDYYGDTYSESYLIVYDGNSWEEVEKFPSRAYSLIEVYNNRLWFAVGKHLYSFDGVNIVQELDLTNDYPDDMFVSQLEGGSTGHRLRRVGDKLYLVINDSTNTISEIFIYNGHGWYRWGEQPDSGTYFDCIGSIDTDSEDPLLMGDSAGKVWKVSAGYSDTDTGYVESSWFDFDQFNIEKVFANMSVYHEALPVNTSVALKYKIDKMSAWYTLGTNSTPNTTMAQYNFPANTKGAKFKYRVELATSTSAYSPTVQDIIVKYRLTPQTRDTKKQWQFNAILAGAPDSFIKLLDNTREKMSGSELRNFLWKAKEKDQFKFVTPQGETVDVVFDELKVVGPYMNDDSKEVEYVAQIVLIEI